MGLGADSGGEDGESQLRRTTEGVEADRFRWGS